MAKKEKSLSGGGDLVPEFLAAMKQGRVLDKSAPGSAPDPEMLRALKALEEGCSPGNPIAGGESSRGFTFHRPAK